MGAKGSTTPGYRISGAGPEGPNSLARGSCERGSGLCTGAFSLFAIHHSLFILRRLLSRFCSLCGRWDLLDTAFQLLEHLIYRAVELGELFLEVGQVLLGAGEGFDATFELGDVFPVTVSTGQGTLL